MDLYLMFRPLQFRKSEMERWGKTVSPELRHQDLDFSEVIFIQTRRGLY